MQDNRVLVEESLSAIEAHQDPARAEFRGNGQGVDSAGLAAFTKARTAKEHYRAALAKLELEERKKELIPAATVKRQTTTIAVKVRDGLRNAPNRIAQSLAGSLTGEVMDILSGVVKWKTKREEKAAREAVLRRLTPAAQSLVANAMEPEIETLLNDMSEQLAGVTE
jgi:hypothetical protein